VLAHPQLYGVEDAGHLTLYELSLLIVKCREGEQGRVAVPPKVARAVEAMTPLPGLDVEAALDAPTLRRIRRVWHAIKSVQEERAEADADERWSAAAFGSPGMPAGLPKRAFLEACGAHALVRTFFEEELALERTTPKPRAALGGADTHPLNAFQTRLGELEGEVLRYQLSAANAGDEAAGDGGGEGVPADRPGAPTGRVPARAGASSDRPDATRLPPVGDGAATRSQGKRDAKGGARGFVTAVGAKEATSRPPLRTSLGWAKSTGAFNDALAPRMEEEESVEDVGRASTALQWTSSALVRRRIAMSTSTAALMRRQHQSRLEALMPRPRGEHRAPMLSATMLHDYLNNTRQGIGKPPLNSSAEELIAATRRGSPVKERVLEYAHSGRILTRPASTYF
jgi:hypothetical protein